MEHKPKILLYDIEVTSPVGDAWRGYETNIHHWRRDWWILCFAYKWYGEKAVKVVAQDDFKGYQKHREDDSHVVKELHRLFTEADIVIAHNGDQFDQKKVNARIIINGLNPPEPYKQIDTRKVAKKYFNFTSNKLDDLARYFGIPGKLDTGGYQLWVGCEAGDLNAWKKMKRYNKQDIVLLEQVYLKMRPWIDNHPNLNLIANRLQSCPRCLAKGQMQSRGFTFKSTLKYRRFQCQNCGAWTRSPSSEKQEKPLYVA